MAKALLTYANVAGVIAQASQDEVIAAINVLKNAIPDISVQNPSGQTPASPYWDEFTPRMAEQLRAELDAIIAAVDAAPTA